MNIEALHILLVDDDEEDYLITQDLLSEIEGKSFDLEWVAAYNDALLAIGRNQHDVYLIDYRLGQRNGLELLTEAIENGCKSPIILLTGQGDREVDLEAMKSGASDYLIKGQIDAALLERSIRYAIERHRANEERASIQEQLLQSQRLESIGQLAGGIAHDFNNLMTPIIGYAQMGLREGVPSDSRLPLYLQEIQKAADRAASLVHQLLAFSRRQVSQIRVVNINDLILNIEMMIQRLIGEDIELVLLPLREIGSVKVDPNQIEQVLVNLVINARDAMPDGGKLIIETDCIDLDEQYSRSHPDVTPGQYVMLAVSDSGVGMTRETQSHIFEPFFTTKEVGKGTGLGLSTCYGLVIQNGGHIWVYSEPGLGTTFKMFLPSVELAPSPLSENDESKYLPRGSETVLLVEDEVLVRDMVNRVLSQQGYLVLEAPNGVEALKLAQERADESIHLLLADLVMPLLGGKELGDKLARIHPETKVLFTSGYTDQTIAHHGMLEPDTNFIQKPYSLAALVKKVREVLNTESC